MVLCKIIDCTGIGMSTFNFYYVDCYSLGPKNVTLGLKIYLREVGI